MINVVSFDIFDTCFVRACGTPKQIFALLAMELLGDTADGSVIADFCHIRRNGEKTARKNSSKEEITLKEIYEYCDFSGLTNVPNSDIAALECNIEKRQLVPVLSVRQTIDEYRRKGCCIIYISDTYMSEEFVMSLLADNGFWHDGDKLYVSSKTLLTKASGNLYEYIAACNGIDCSTWRHHGDNPISDVAQPRKLGIKTSAINHCYTYYERKTLNFGFGINHDVNESFVSVAKSVRLYLPEDKRYTFACDLIAPLYVPFVYKILQDAEKRGLNKLFFLSRDGFILYQIASLLKQLCFPAIEISYLYVSRKSLYLPGYKTISDSDVMSVLTEIFSRSAPHKNIVDYFNDWLPTNITSKIIETIPVVTSAKTIEEAVGYMKASQSVISLLKEHLLAQKTLILKYFIQEGVADRSAKTGIIDLRGTRRCGKIINDILTENGFLPVFGYYLDVEEKRCLSTNNEKYMSVLTEENIRSTDRLRNYMDITMMLEQYFSVSPHSRISHYKNVEGKIEPVHENTHSDPDITDAFQKNQTIIEPFVKYYVLNKLYKYNEYCLGLGIESLCDFADYPHHDYLEALQNFKCENLYGSPCVMVKKLSLIELWKNNVGWYKGAFALTHHSCPRFMYEIIIRIINKLKLTFKF